jgi:hypothetical protein
MTITWLCWCWKSQADHFKKKKTQADKQTWFVSTVGVLLIESPVHVPFIWRVCYKSDAWSLTRDQSPDLAVHFSLRFVRANLFFIFCSYSNLFQFKISSHSIFVHILNLIRFEICSNSKSVHIPDLFRFKFCSNSILFTIQNFDHIQLFPYSEFVPNLFKFWSNFVHNSNFVQKGRVTSGNWSLTRDQSPDLQTRPWEHLEIFFMFFFLKFEWF